MKNEEVAITAAYEVFTTAWRFYRKHWKVSKSDEYWKVVIEESNELYKTNPSPLLRGLLVAIIQEMERRTKAYES